MQSDNHTFLQVLRVQNCELWNSMFASMALEFHGDLQILYSKALQMFILRINELQLILDKSVQIIGSVVGRHEHQAYILASKEGFSMIRLMDEQPGPYLKNLETIFENTTDFSRRTGLDSILGTFREVDEHGMMASFMKKFDSITRIFHASAENESHPNQKLIRSFDELIDIDSNSAPIVDMPQKEIDGLKQRLENDTNTYQDTELFKRFLSGESQSFDKLSHQRTSDIQALNDSQNQGKNLDSANSDKDIATFKYHPSIDHQEIVGAQQQRLPAYEVHNTKGHVERGLRKASTNLQQGETEQMELPEPEDFDDDAFTTGLLNKNYKEVVNIGEGKDFPVAQDDAFMDLPHPMRKHSLIDRPFLNIDEEPEYTKENKAIEKEETQRQGGFVAQPILTAKGEPTLRSDIDEQPSPISNTEKYSKEITQPEPSEFEKATAGVEKDLQIPFSTVGQENILRQSSQGNESKKQKKTANESVDKENLRETTAI